MRPWPFKKRVYWCPSCNIPLREETCSICGSTGFELPIAEPRDLRPAFAGDIMFIREAITNEFGSDSLLKIFNIKEGSTYLNKTAHYDDMKEVIVGGTIVGRIFFDPLTLRWRWRLNKLSAEIAASLGLVKKVVTDSVRPLQDLGSASEPEDTQYVVVNRIGEVTALALSRKGRIRIQTIFKSKVSEPLKRSSNIYTMIKGNEEHLRKLISKGIKHVAIMSERVKLPVLVSYSGGKDSLVTLHLALRAGIEPSILFNDTGLELPPVIKNVNLITRKYGLKSHIASAGEKFWYAVRTFGPPGRDYRWCCKVVKLAPIAEIYKKRFPKGALTIIGQRAFESVDRARSGSVWRNRWLPSILNITPIQEWDQLSIWAYIIVNRLPVNELYFKGFDRLGCYLCPAGNLAEYCLIRRNYPDLWLRWENELKVWKKKLEMPDIWVKYHLWRWLNPEAVGRRRIEVRLGIKKPSAWVNEYIRRSGFSVELVEYSSDKVVLKVSPTISSEGIFNQMKVLGASIYRDTDGFIEVTGFNFKVIIFKNKVIAHGNDPLEKAITVLKLSVRWEKCVGCGNCVRWCPNQAIFLEGGKPKVNSRYCISCGACLEVCPLTEMFAEKLITSQIIGDPKGRKRKERPLIIELEKAKRLSAINPERNKEIRIEGLDAFLHFPKT